MACLYRFGPPEIQNLAEADKIMHEKLIYNKASGQVLPKLWYENVGFSVDGKQVIFSHNKQLLSLLWMFFCSPGI
jgi:hypothetical protein